MRERVETYRKYLTALFLAGAWGGMVFSPPILSIGLIGLFVVGVFDPLYGLNPRWRESLPATLRSSLFWGMAGLYLLLVFGAWQTTDWAYYFERLRVKIPLLALPLALPGWPVFSRRERTWLLYGAALFVAVVLAGVLANYALHFGAINGLVERGKPVPVPRNHIRFSLIVALATLCALGAFRLSGRRRWAVLAAALFVGQHFLAVRSGLVGAYAGGGALVLWWMWKSNGGWAWLGLVGLVLLPLVAYLTVPSLRTKIQYARYELLHRDKSVDQAEYSDEGRLASWRIGLDLWRENPVFGVGPGNLLLATDDRYAIEYPGVKGKRPHNQFISALAGSGLVGFVVTVVCFVLLFRHGWRRRLPVYLAAWLVLFLSCLVENTLENTVGVSLFVVVLIFFCQRDMESKRFLGH